MNFNLLMFYRYCPRTTFDESDFPLYKRRRKDVFIHVRGADLDNQWVVPYNRDLLAKYQCHMNVEICCHARSLKYLFKYRLKGYDRATIQVNGRRRRSNIIGKEEQVDEINAYFDGRYLCGSEVAYRIFGFLIHHCTLSVERLRFIYWIKEAAHFVLMNLCQKLFRERKKSVANWKPFFY